jgi:Cu(I)/Ag(I) efflux system membrane fusion protein
MKRTVYSLTLIVALGGAVLTLSLLSQRSLSGKNRPGRQILYYVDPMHPSYKSYKPGIAPDCNMRLEPVYAEENKPAPPAHAHSAASSMVATLSPEQQQRIGIQVSAVEKTAATHTIRLFGRVAPDETRIYKLIAGMDGVVRQVAPVTTGSQVTAGQLLATLSAPELRAPLQGYVVSLDVIDRQREGGAQAPAQIQAAKESSQQALDRLLNLGLSQIQLEEIMRTREVPTDLKVYAPVAGIVLARNVSVGQRFDKNTEWFRIADLRRVWVTADVFENDARYIEPGRSAHVTLPGGSAAATARVSEVLPEFDAASRTLKVRFELENSSYAFRPDMFVDVQLPVALPASIAVPVEAVLDSGLRKTVFVDRGNGRFESREVQTGWRSDGRVQIVAGLQAGERIVTSANFLLDSETRMQGTGAVKSELNGSSR